MQTSPPIKAATRPLRSPPKAAKALREPLLARGDQEAGAASGAQPPQPSDDTAYAAHLKAAMYGVINAVVCAPVMIGFAAIIFRHPAFHADPAVYPALVNRLSPRAPAVSGGADAVRGARAGPQAPRVWLCLWCE
jgi:hypothetical protein